MTIVAAAAQVLRKRHELSPWLRAVSVQGAVVAMLLVPALAAYAIADGLMPAELAAGRALVVAALLVLAAFVFPEVRRGAYERADRIFPDRCGCRRALTGVIHEIASMLDVHALARTLGGRLREAIDADAVELWLRDGADGRYRRINERDLAGPANTIAGDGAARLDDWIDRAIAQPRFVRSGPGAEAVDRVLARMAGRLCFPLWTKTGPLGVLAIALRRSDRFYLPEHIELLSVLADQVAVVAENARLYQELTASNRKLSESRQLLQRASRLTTIGTLAAGLAHEIRNPLAAVQTFLQILPERLADPEITVDFRNVALSEVQRVSKLVTEMLNMSRTQTARFERTPLDEVVEQVVRLVRVQAERRRVELRRTGEALPEGYADAARLKQALLNVVLNAVEATAPGTEVTVGTRTGVDDTGRRLVEFVIRDQGPGVPADRRELIFQPFATTKESGTGLGLAVTRQIVADHGGCIEVESEEGAGATFVVRVPVEQRATGAPY